MKGRDHSSITLMWAFLIMCPIMLTEPIIFVSFLIGAVIGAIFPDIDGGVSPYENKGEIMQFAGLIFKPAKLFTFWVFGLICPERKKELVQHRGIIHSIPGIVLCLGIVLVPLNLLILIIGYWNVSVLIFSLGLLAGAFFHLLEDSCTCSGVRLFYPFTEYRLRGGVNTLSTKREDDRPSRFASMFVLLSVAVLVIDLLMTDIPIFLTIVLGFLCWGVMYRLSQKPNNCKQGSFIYNR